MTLNGTNKPYLALWWVVLVVVDPRYTTFLVFDRPIITRF